MRHVAERSLYLREETIDEHPPYKDLFLRA